MKKIFYIFILILFAVAANFYGSKKENATKTGAKSFNEEYDYMYFSDGSCIGGQQTLLGHMEKCINLTEYKELCNLSEDITTWTRDLAAVLYSGSKADFIRSGGYYEGFNKEWGDSSNRCAANFTISGILDGTTTNMTISGTAYSFIKLDGEILINGISEIN